MNTTPYQTNKEKQTLVSEQIVIWIEYKMKTNKFGIAISYSLCEIRAR